MSPWETITPAADAPVGTALAAIASEVKVKESVPWTRYFDDLGKQFGVLDARTLGVWQPLSNGDIADPELIFANGEVIMAFQPLP